MKFAYDEAQKLGSNIHLGGLELDNFTIRGLYHESRMDILPLIWRYLKMKSDRWDNDENDIKSILSDYGAESFSESIDRSRANWFVKFFAVLSPHQKKIVVDMKDIEIFKTLYSRVPGKNIVAVVNQWHMAGIEERWKSVTGTQEKTEPINPIGDFDINEHMEGELINDNLRMLTSRITKSEPATWSNYLTQYNKEPQESHRTRHISFDDASDPHMYHGLPWDTHGKKVDPKIQFNIRPNSMELNTKEGLEELKRLVKEQESHLQK